MDKRHRCLASFHGRRRCPSWVLRPTVGSALRSAQIFWLASCERASDRSCYFSGGVRVARGGRSGGPPRDTRSPALPRGGLPSSPRWVPFGAAVRFLFSPVVRWGPWRRPSVTVERSASESPLWGVDRRACARPRRKRGSEAWALPGGANPAAPLGRSRLCPHHHRNRVLLGCVVVDVWARRFCGEGGRESPAKTRAS